MIIVVSSFGIVRYQVNRRGIARKTCHDSDGGMNASLKGTTTNEITSHMDNCKNVSTVIEYYCLMGQIAVTDITCSNRHVCADGACYNTVNLNGNRTSFVSFPTIYFDQSPIHQSEVIKVTDLIYWFEGELNSGNYPTETGMIPSPESQEIAWDPLVYGTSGFPIHLGDPALPAHNLDRDHYWHVMAHEMGHNFWGASNLFYTIASPGPFLQESTAVLTAEYVFQRIRSDGLYFWLQDETFLSLERVFEQERNYQSQQYALYRSQISDQNNPYSQEDGQQGTLTSQALDYQIFMIADSFGWNRLPLLRMQYSDNMKNFLENNNKNFWFDGVTEAEETTYTIGALAATFKRDFRSDFLALKFPIDGNFYNNFLPILNEYVDDHSYSLMDLSFPERIGTYSFEQNGVTFPICGFFDEKWCASNNPNADGEGPFEFRWGDGNMSCSWFPGTHLYSNSGTYTIRVRSHNTCGFTAERQSRISF